MSDEWQDEYVRMIDDCMQRESKCSEWEQNFLDSLSNQISRGRFPTEKQIAVLDRVWERVTR